MYALSKEIEFCSSFWGSNQAAFTPTYVAHSRTFADNAWGFAIDIAQRFAGAIAM
jgi:hypothetical protein